MICMTVNFGLVYLFREALWIQFLMFDWDFIVLQKVQFVFSNIKRNSLCSSFFTCIKICKLSLNAPLLERILLDCMIVFIQLWSQNVLKTAKLSHLITLWSYLWLYCVYVYAGICRCFLSSSTITCNYKSLISYLQPI